MHWFWRLWPLLAARRGLLAAGLGCAGLMIVGSVAFPRVVMSTIDLALTERSEPISKYAWILAVIALVSGLGSGVFRYSIQKVSMMMEYDLRAGIYEHMLGLSFSFYDHAQTGQLGALRAG